MTLRQLSELVEKNNGFREKQEQAEMDAFVKKTSASIRALTAPKPRAKPHSFKPLLDPKRHGCAQCCYPKEHSIHGKDQAPCEPQ